MHAFEISLAITEGYFVVAVLGWSALVRCGRGPR